MKKIVNLMTICTVLIVGIVACSNGGIDSIQATFFNNGETYPTGEFTTYSVSLVDSSGEPVSVEKLYFYMNMEKMNHPMEGTMKEVKEGLYEIELPLAMPGEWYVNVTIFNGKEERALDSFTVYAEGDMVMEYMRGFNSDLE
ncbi:FixH family protein [Evansella sp. AB-rgal1]|uniref:FixH family protein n=1 Tax=Evansella sp. AB-rgal1 TaxID=3242696 RepID=UPI00359D204D